MWLKMGTSSGWLRTISSNPWYVSGSCKKLNANIVLIFCLVCVCGCMYYILIPRLLGLLRVFAENTCSRHGITNLYHSNHHFCVSFSATNCKTQDILCLFNACSLQRVRENIPVFPSRALCMPHITSLYTASCQCIGSCPGKREWS